MDYVTLGKTGLAVSYLGLGGIPIQKTDAKETTILIKRMQETRHWFYCYETAGRRSN